MVDNPEPASLFLPSYLAILLAYIVPSRLPTVSGSFFTVGSGARAIARSGLSFRSIKRWLWQLVVTVD